MPEEKLATGWIRTAAGIYQHLHTRVCSWLPPYIRKCEDTYDQHKPAARFALALDRDEKPARRRRQSCEIVVRNSEQKDEAAPKKDDNQLPESLAWIGLEVKGKSPVNLLNELGPKLFRCYPEFPTTTQEDAVNPYLTTVVMENIVIARGGFTNKKMSRQIAAREALKVLCPLLRLGTDYADSAVDDEDSATPGGVRVLGAKRISVADLEAKEVATLRLKLTDDKILDSTVGKTPVMVLQEHCHKHVGRVPTYTDATETAQGQRAARRTSVRSGPQSFTVKVMVFGGIEGTGVDTTKKRAKQRGALEVLRQLYPHVKLWGDLVESTNSRQRILRAAGEAKRQRICGPEAGASAASTVQENTTKAQRMLEIVREQLWARIAAEKSPQLDLLPRKRSVESS
jgi:hypothetical protein